jgi:hypothetical protein
VPRYRVTCTTKLEKHEHIVSLGCYTPEGKYQTLTETEAIARLEGGSDTFYSERPDGHVAEIVVETREGEKYLKTKPDGERPNNLDWLPDCPAKPHTVIVPPRTVIPAASHASLGVC